MTIQRRTQQRYDIRLPVEFTFDGTDYQAQTRNMSLGGMFIETASPVTYGAIVKLVFRLPALQEPVEIQGEVRWVEKDGGLTKGIGVQFQGLRAKHVWALNKLFANLASKET